MGTFFLREEAELQPARPVGAAGGLYIMEGTEANRSFPALAAGDAFVHGHELLHGPLARPTWHVPTVE